MRELIYSSSGWAYVPLCDELKDLSKQGVRLTLGGKECSPERIARTCIMSENCNYMRDYVTDGDGRVVRVDFNKIKLESL